MIEVAIAGAGPAGVATAVAILRRDPSLRGRVVLFDRARFPRPKPCGGGLTGHAVDAIAELGLSLRVPHAAAPCAEVIYGALRREVNLGRPVCVVRREEFDCDLVAQARDLGVVVREGVAIDGFHATRDRVEFGAGGRSEQARVLVGADGVGSAIRKQLLGERSKGNPSASRKRPIRLFHLEIPRAAHFRPDTMLYDFTPMADGLRGYMWIFPVPGGRLNVGLMHDPRSERSGAELTALLERHLHRYDISLPGPARGWPAWGYLPQGRVSGERVLLCGDAAGIDALTGEGIGVGMEQGLVAAGHIVTALETGDFRFLNYARALRRATVGRELALDGVLSRLLYVGDWERWLSLVLMDDQMLALYAARVSGTLVLADQSVALFRALCRHVVKGGRRRARLRAALER